MPTRKRDSGRPMVHLRRMYVDCRYGQMHLRSAFAANGGFDEQTTLVCLHPVPMTSRVFEPFLRLMGGDRSAYAPDLPGFGASDGPTELRLEDHAAAIGDVIDHLRLRRVDLLGHESGAAVAAELAIARPTQVRRVVLVGAPALGEAERGRLSRVTQPVLLLRPRGGPREVTPQAKHLLPEARSVDLPDCGPDLFEAAPDVVARHVRAFVDA